MDESVINLVVQVEPAAPIPRERLEKAIRWLLLREGVEGATLSVVLTDDDTVRALNDQYRGVDAVTDVLSFGADRDSQSGEDADLGDLIIAVPYLTRQAEAQNHAFDDELLLTVVHGALHLLGYDHDSRDHEEAMWTLQAEALDVAEVLIEVLRFFEDGADHDAAGEAG